MTCQLCEDRRKIVIVKTDKTTGAEYATPIDCPSCTGANAGKCSECGAVTLYEDKVIDGKKVPVAVVCPCHQRPKGTHHAPAFVQAEQPEPEPQVKPGEKPPHFLLNKKLYEQCNLCKGTLKIAVGAVSDGMACPECTAPGNTHPGFCEIGMTVAQLERIHGERDFIVKFLARMEHGFISLGLDGAAHQCTLALERINKSSVSRARFEVDQEERARLGYAPRKQPPEQPRAFEMMADVLYEVSQHTPESLGSTDFAYRVVYEAAREALRHLYTHDLLDAKARYGPHRPLGEKTPKPLPNPQ